MSESGEVRRAWIPKAGNKGSMNTIELGESSVATKVGDNEDGGNLSAGKEIASD